MGPRLTIVNPLRWEIGHVAWFCEKFILRDLYGNPPLYPPGDQMYDSIAIHHETRWDLPLLSMPDTLAYVQEVLDRCLARLEPGMASEQDSHIYQFAAFHQDMHTEAYTYTRQTLSYPPPEFDNVAWPADAQAGAWPGDAAVPGGEFMLGSERDAPFIFDNEKWAHAVILEPFEISKAPVTQSQFADFVDAEGYQNRDFWDDQGWLWRQQAEAEHPVYWSRGEAGNWRFRRFDQYEDVPAHQAMIHVNWHEAKAWCKWANRRLPTEAEWEAAALGEPSANGNQMASQKRTYPWGDEAPQAHHANQDGRALGCLDVAACAAGDSAFGCRQMMGNVWEWTSSIFTPYTGFSPDAYKDYSQPVFDQTKVLKGGAWATRSRMLTGRHRNFFTADRRDVMAGFRTCAR
jgi:iron(II)-dependent oxidoreductase